MRALPFWQWTTSMRRARISRASATAEARSTSLRIGMAAWGMPAAAHCSAQTALGRVPTTTSCPRAWSPQARSRSWMAAPVK